MRISTFHTVAWMSALVINLAGDTGCARKAVQSPPKVAATPPVPATHASPTATRPATPAGTAELGAGDLKDVHFDYEQSDLRKDARDALDFDANLLRAHRIQGHCDERGTVEYNLALGERRANSVRDYLVSSGVDSAKITTISYGKDRPLCSEHDESCWAKNRCAHLVLLSGPA